jgi:hypothetical protein
MLVFLSMLAFFLVRGNAFKKKKHIAGRKRLHPFLLRWRLKIRRQASNLKIANLPLFKGTETQHILVTRGTGTGKTNCFHHLLPQIRQRKQKAVIIDTTGTSLKDTSIRKRTSCLIPLTIEELLGIHG